MMFLFSAAAALVPMPGGVPAVPSRVPEPAAVLKGGDATLTKPKISGDADANRVAKQQYIVDRSKGATTFRSTRATTADEVRTPTLAAVSGQQRMVGWGLGCARAAASAKGCACTRGEVG